MADETNLELLQSMAEQLQAAEQPEMSEEEKHFFDYGTAKIGIDKMIDSWNSHEVPEAKKRRKERYVDITPEELRASGDIEEDETIIPERVIDTNINRESPELLNFLKGGDRLAIFRCLTNPTLDTSLLEEEFTNGLTYPGWYKEFQRWIDGAALHGIDHMEVVFDTSKPFHVGFEHVGYDRLFYNKSVFNIQDSEYAIRPFEISAMRLKINAQKFGFDESQVQIILEHNEKESRDPNRILTIYKVYFKYNNCVYVCWYCKEANVSDWLKAPEKLFLGIQKPNLVNEIVIDPLTGLETSQQNLVFEDVELDMYPYFPFIYKEDEQPEIYNKKGRAFMDWPVQEAVTTLMSALTNGVSRASNTYASPRTEDGENAEMKQLDITLKHGAIFSRPLDFFNLPYPDPAMFHAIQALKTSNADNTGKPAYAVMNRKDSRKTAEELKQAGAEQAKLSSTVIGEFSEAIRSMFAFTWNIVKSRAAQNKIRFLGQSNGFDFVNDTVWFEQQYDIRAAGDVDVILRQQTIAQMKQDWPVFANFPGLSQVFIKELIKLSYPKRATMFIQALEAGDMASQIIQQLLTVLGSSIQPEEWSGLTPEQQQGLTNIVQQAQQYIALKSGAPQQPAQ